MAAMWLVRLRLARRLNPAQCAAKIIQLAFVGQFLAFGNFNQFQNFINPVNHFFE